MLFSYNDKNLSFLEQRNTVLLILQIETKSSYFFPSGSIYLFSFLISSLFLFSAVHEKQLKQMCALYNGDQG